jgi:hypothetical protein
MKDYEINDEKTLDMLLEPDRYKIKVYTVSENDRPKKLLFVRNTPIADTEIEGVLYKKGFRQAQFFFVIIYNKDGEKIVGGSLWFAPHPEEPINQHFAGDEPKKEKASNNDENNMLKMYQLGAENSLNTMKEMQNMFQNSLGQYNRTLEEQNKQIQGLQQELIKVMKRQEREDKKQDDGSFMQMLSGFAPLISQIATGNNKTEGTNNNPMNSIKPFPINKNFNFDRDNEES